MPYTRMAGDPPEGTWLPKTELVNGATYEGRCRNASQAIWRAERNAFEYRRYKFGHWFNEDAPHPDDGYGYDVFFPFKLATEDQK